MVKRGRMPKAHVIEEEICRVLMESGGLGFNELYERLKKSPEDRRPGSYTTLSRCLKSLVDGGLVYRDVHSRRWTMSHFGRLSIKAEEQVSKLGLKREFKQSALFLIIKEAHPEAWWTLVERTVGEFGIDRYAEQLGLSKDEFMRNLKSYTEQTKNAFTGLWGGIVSDNVLDVGVLLALTQSMRAFYPSPLRREDMEKLSRFTNAIAESYAEYWIKYLRDILSLNVASLEVLAALDRAIRDGKLRPQDFEGKPLEEIIRKLQELKLLEVIKED